MAEFLNRRFEIEKTDKSQHTKDYSSNFNLKSFSRERN